MTDTELQSNIWLRLHYESGQVPMNTIRQAFRAQGFDLVAVEEPVADGWAVTEDWAALETAYMRANPSTVDRSRWDAFRAAADRLGYRPAREGGPAQEDTTGGLVEARSRMANRGKWLRWQRVAEGGAAYAPKYEGDVGVDLASVETVMVQPGGVTYLRTGVAFAAPAGFWILLVGRSSLAAKLGLAMVPGVIDNGYRGEMLAGVYPIGPGSVRVEKGTRVAQAILMPVVEPALEEVKWLPESDRGHNGFGSTGGTT